MRATQASPALDAEDADFEEGTRSFQTARSSKLCRQFSEKDKLIRTLAQNLTPHDTDLHARFPDRCPDEGARRGTKTAAPEGARRGTAPCPSPAPQAPCPSRGVPRSSWSLGRTASRVDGGSAPPFSKDVSLEADESTSKAPWINIYRRSRAPLEGGAAHSHSEASAQTSPPSSPLRKLRLIPLSSESPHMNLPDVFQEMLRLNAPGPPKVGGGRAGRSLSIGLAQT